MSKASEWATGYGKRPQIKMGHTVFKVGESGGLNVDPVEYGGISSLMVQPMTADEAMVLARWLLDTFGDGNG